MMLLFLAAAALSLACIGLLWAILWIRQTNQSVASVWPDWEGIRNPAPLWTLLTLATALAVGGIVLYARSSPTTTSKPLATSTTPPADSALQAEINRLKAQLAEVTQAQPATDLAEVTPADIAEATPTANETAEAPSPVPNVDFAQRSARPEKQILDPRIEQYNKAVIEALVSGSVKPLQNVGHKTLLDQFTIDPFNFSQLQFGLKERLRGGYTPIYLTSLRSITGTNYVWKIKTVDPGPDILERLAVAQGKVTGFRFDGLN